MIGEVEVVRCEHGDNAGHRLGIIGVDRLDPGVRDGRPDERDVQEPLDVEVVEILDFTGEDAGILPADHRVPENRTGRDRNGLGHVPCASCRDCGGTLTRHL